MRGLIFTICFLLIMSFASAALEVTQEPIYTTVIIGSDQPAKFNLTIKNTGIAEKFEIYTLVGVSITPKESITIGTGETKEITIEARPSDEILRNNRGPFTFEYQIKGTNSGIIKDNLRIKIIELSELLEARIYPFSGQDDKAILQIRNLDNNNVQDIKISVDSDFFNEDFTVSIPKFERQNLTLPIDKNSIKKLQNGVYETDIDLEYKGTKDEIRVSFDYLESAGLAVRSNTEGFIIRKETTEKINTGNTPITATITSDKNIFTRLFTSFSQEPTSVEKDGFVVHYTWQKEITPGESFKITSTTNYTLPFIIILAIVIVILGLRFYFDSNLVLKKRVSFVRTTSNELALKVQLQVKAKKTAENIKIMDRVPGMTKLYGNFGVNPDFVDHDHGRIGWKINRLNAGEQRIFSYIIHSKLKIVGKFELPQAHATYTVDGKHKDTLSNKSYFMAETISRH